MKQTNFRFFKNTPLIDFQNTIHFDSNAARDAFFLEGAHYAELDVTDVSFNFIRDRSEIVINKSYQEFQGVNYCTFKSDFEDTRYYAYVMNYEYLSDGAIRVTLLIDGIMTFTQGNILETLPNLTITRQHLTKANYNTQLWELKNNGDILKATTKAYFHTDRLIFDDLLVVIQSSAALKGDFGNVDNPKIKTSRGMNFDKITSPLNLYACDKADFNKLMDELSDYTWISQNIKSLSLIPRDFMAENLTLITFDDTDTLKNVNYLYEITGVKTNKTALLAKVQEISKDMDELYTLFEIGEDDRHLLRNEYTTIELYNYAGGQLFVDIGQLNEYNGLNLWIDLITGYYNEMKVYINQYRVNETPSEFTGAYVNDSLVFNQFDDIPMLIDNFNLSLSKSANQRQLAEGKLVTNRIGSVMNPNADLKDRFFNAASLASNLSPSNLFGKFTDEYEFYRTQKAEQADMALETPSITSQTNGNSFNIANNNFGIHVKYSRPNISERKKIKKYYKLFGFEQNDNSNMLDKVNSMSICNYVQFSGSWTLPNTDVSIIEMMKAQFENGVRLWHADNSANPMTKDVLNNVMVM